MKLKNLTKNISLIFIFLAMILSCQYGPITEEEEKYYYYWVEHYLQNIDDDDEYTRADIEKESVYKYESEVKYTSATAKYSEGFIVHPITQMKIANDESTVVKIYYDRKRITLTLDLDGGEGTTEIRGRYGATVTAPTAPTKAGYIFAGWDPELPSTFPETSGLSNFPWGHYTAKWKDTTKITYNLNGGQWAYGFTPEVERKLGTKISLPSVPDIKKTNYTFDGWYDKNGDKIIEISSDTTTDVTVTAQWR